MISVSDSDGVLYMYQHRRADIPARNGMTIQSVRSNKIVARMYSHVEKCQLNVERETAYAELATPASSHQWPSNE